MSARPVCDSCWLYRAHIRYRRLFLCWPCWKRLVLSGAWR